jgi:Kef-type K+ transport system membrane component KefB
MEKIHHLMQPQAIPLLGIALMACLAVGRQTKKYQIPSVTGFILVGIILGPSCFNLLTEEITHQLDFINKVAFGLILFNIGGEFNKDLFRTMAAKQVRNSVLTSLGIMITMSLTIFTGAMIFNMPITESIALALFLSITAMLAAPPTTVSVIKEYGSKGPLSQSILVYLAVSTLMALTLGEGAIIGFESLGIWKAKDDLAVHMKILLFIWSIIGSIGFGILLGFILAYWEQKEKKQGELILVVASTIVFGLSLSYYLKLDPLLLSFTLGFAVANTSNEGRDIHKGVKEMGLSIYALFFVLAGSHVNVKHLLSVGLLGLFYIFGRPLCVWVSAQISGKLVSEDKSVIKHKGLSLVSHGGGAIALGMKLKGYDAQSAQIAVSIITSTIFIFEIVGPLLLKKQLNISGEIKDLAKNKSSSSKAPISLEQLVRNFLENLSITESDPLEEAHSIKEITKKNILAIKLNAPLREISKFIDSHSYPIYNVVDDQHIYCGVIDLEKFKQARLDMDNNSFIIAQTLLSESELPIIPEGCSFKEAQAHFEQTELDVLPVVNPHSKFLVGILSKQKLMLEMPEDPAPDTPNLEV